jgi:hypothetical protein
VVALSSDVPLTPLPPPSARALGVAGLLPFVGGAAVLIAGPAAWQGAAGVALLAYAATIASFLGGVHWGLAMRGSPGLPQSLVWGVLPQLAGWGALLLPLRPGLVVAALVLAVCYAVDRSRYRAAGLAAWLPLRATLTAGAVLCCLVGAASA